MIYSIVIKRFTY